MLREKLRQVDSLAIILPQDAYSKEEVDVLKRFVKKGGRLLLIGDPTRHNHVNSVAEEFGMLFQDGYLYNVIEHDINYRNIFLRDFFPDEVTNGLRQVNFYTAGSIRSSEILLISTDNNTLSSTVERTQPFSPVVKSRDGLILAIAELTFMIPPHDTMENNARFIANTADFLTESKRRFDIEDFPYFFKDQVDISIGRSSLFEVATQMKSVLRRFEINSQVKGVEDLLKDTVFIGLYDDSSSVSQYLEVAGVQISDTVRTAFTSDIPKEGTGIVLLHKGSEGRQVLVLLGDTQGTLVSIVNMLFSGEFRTGLVGDFLGVYRSF